MAGKKNEVGEEDVRTVTISKPDIRTIPLTIMGLTPYVQHRFSQKAMLKMKAAQLQGSQGKKNRAKEPRDFNADYEGAKHYSTEGWIGIPAGCFRNAMISACRLIGFKMTIAKLSVFVEHDGIDSVDGVPLIRIEGKPEPMEMAVKNATGVADLRVRPMWRKWSANLRVSFDGGQFSEEDVANLLERAGRQVGIGEGRPDSKSSAGLGWGTFEIKKG